MATLTRDNDMTRDETTSVNSPQNFVFCDKIRLHNHTRDFMYEVLYQITGVDHEDGYCSNLEEDDMNAVDKKERRVLVSDVLVLNLNKFNFIEYGCTSYKLGRGSGYCRGAKQFYTAIEMIQIYKWNDEKNSYIFIEDAKDNDDLDIIRDE